jgi:uncharacterized protein
MELRCPICRKPVELASEFAPFCSERHKLLDLGNWASGRYVIRTPMSEEDVIEELDRSGGAEGEFGSRRTGERAGEDDEA